MNFLKSKHFSIPTLAMMINSYYYLVVRETELMVFLNESLYQFVILMGVFFYLHNDRLFVNMERKLLKMEKVELEERITTMDELVKNLSLAAAYDDTTHLPNKRTFRSRLQDSLDQYMKNDESIQHKCALFYVDLNNFKQVNDTLGHKAGDSTLHEVAKRLKSCVRPNDMVARIGGDEFAILISGDVSATKVMERMVKKFPTRGIQIESGKYVKVGISIGAVRFDKHLNSATELMTIADRAMYFTKFKCKESHTLSGHSWSGGKPRLDKTPS